MMETEKLEGAKDGAVEVEPEGRQDAQEEAPSAEDSARKRKIAIVAAAAAVVLVAAVGIGVAVGMNRPAPVEAGAPAASQAQVRQTGEEKAEESAVVVTVKAEGADAGATKAKVVATGAGGEVVVPETEVAANEASGIGRLSKGRYELHVTAAPVCEDGSSYKLPEKPLAFDVDGKGADARLDVKLERIAAEDMTKEQLEASAAALEESGKPEASEAARAKAESAESVPGSDSAVKRDPEPTLPPSGDGGSGSNGSGGGSDSGSTAPGNPSNPPAHEHSWTPVTKTVHHDAVYSTVHHDAVYDMVHHDAVKEGRIVCSCGAILEPANYEFHLNSSLENGTIDNCGGYYTTSVIVQEAYDEQVLVSAAYDEQVLATAAWDETVTTGYTCSCGATK